MRLKERFLRILGDMKIQKYPPFIIYDPNDYYDVSGLDTSTAMSLIKPGDVLCRGYKNYVDGFFIPGEYSHSGLYVGGNTVIHAIAEGVSVCDIIDFLRCDRFIILRPKKGQKKAIERARALLGTKYDYDFTDGVEALYCHELVATCYKELDIRKVTPYMGIFRFYKMEPRYLAESFINSDDFSKILECPNKQEKK